MIIVLIFVKDVTAHMGTSFNVKLQTGFFERTPYTLNAKAEGLVFKPSAKNGAAVPIPAAGIKSIVFYEANRKMEIQTNELTEAYFANDADWFEAMMALKETLGMKIVCEMNQAMRKGADQTQA